MESHDLCIPLAASNNHEPASNILLLLLSAADHESSDVAMGRIQRLYLQGGSNRVAVLFLLQESSANNIGLISMVNLQIRYQQHG